MIGNERLRRNSFSETVGDVKGETLEKTLHHGLVELEAAKPDDTVRNMGAEALGDKLTDRVAEVKVVKVGETLTDLKATSRDLTLAATLAEIVSETACKTPSDVDTFSATL